MKGLGGRVAYSTPPRPHLLCCPPRCIPCISPPSKSLLPLNHFPPFLTLTVEFRVSAKVPLMMKYPPPLLFCARCQWVNCLRIGRRTGLSFLTQKQLWFPCPRQSNAKWDGHHMSSQDWSYLNFHQGALGILRVWLFEIILVLGVEGRKWVTRWVQRL